MDLGAIIAGLLGAGGNIAGALIQQESADKAIEASLTGYRYLTEGDGKVPSQAYINAGQTGLTNSLNAQNAQAQLLGLAPMGEGTQNAFNNYLNSSGYNFQMDQGMDALTSNAATRGLLNSGATIKGATEFGQGLAATHFNNYLSQLGNVNNQAHNTATMGQNQITTVANAGAGAGSNAAPYIAAGGDAWASGINGALGNLANIFSRPMGGK